jgi:hypothetical protein
MFSFVQKRKRKNKSAIQSINQRRTSREEMGESLEEIGERLRLLLEQYKQVELALGQDPQNEELINARKEFLEIVTLTEDLYNIKKAELMPPRPPAAAPPLPAAHAPPPPMPTSAWPDAAAAAGPFVVGSRVQALYHTDGLWYDAVIDAITDDGTYKVRMATSRAHFNGELSELIATLVGSSPRLLILCYGGHV